MGQGGETGAGRQAGLAALLVVCTLLAYLPAVGAGFIWDDDAYVTDNRTLRSVEGLQRIWFQVGAVPQYYPLVHTTFWLEYRLWGLNPAGYHVVNILLHALAAVVLWRILRRLQLPGAWVAAALFALHPVHVESVAWITERKNVLSGVFYLAALLAYLRFDHRASRDPGRRRWGLYALALLAFAAALLSKTTAATLPAALLVILWWRRGAAPWPELPRLVPFFALGVGLGLHTVWVEKTVVGATGLDFTLSWVERWLVAGRALWFYAGKLAWPQPLIFLYPRWQLDAAAAWQHLFPLAALAVGIGLWAQRKRLGRGPAAAVWLFAGTLFPALGFFAVYPMRFSFVADHFQYLASIGLLVLAACGVARLATRSPRSILQGPAGMVLVAVVLLVFGGLTWSRARAYHDLETLWRDTLQKNPQAWLAHNNLGTVLVEQGDPEQAIEHFTRAVEVKPDYSMAYFNRGTSYLALGRVDEALQDFGRAIEIDATNAEAYVNRALLLQRRGQGDAALEDYRKALEIAPWSHAAHNNLGTLHQERGEQDLALAEYDAALELKDDYVQAFANRGNLHLDRGEFHAALADLDRAVQLDPGNAALLRARGLALGSLERYRDAAADYSRSLEMEPGNPQAYYFRGLARARQGQHADAIADFTEALQLQPGDPQALYNRALSLVETRQLEAALADVQALEAQGRTVPQELKHAVGRGNR
jgi:tetratricopeptide (TPR) repeat protein